VLENPLLMFATAPQILGRTGDIVLGKKSGKVSIEYYLDKLGFKISDGNVGEILDQLKAMGV